MVESTWASCLPFGKTLGAMLAYSYNSAPAAVTHPLQVAGTSPTHINGLVRLSPVHFLYPPRTLLFVSKREPIEALADGFDPREPQHASFEGGRASGKEGALVHSVHCEPPDAPETRKATRFTGARRASPTRGPQVLG